MPIDNVLVNAGQSLVKRSVADAAARGLDKQADVAMGRVERAGAMSTLASQETAQERDLLASFEKARNVPALNEWQQSSADTKNWVDAVVADFPKDKANHDAIGNRLYTSSTSPVNADSLTQLARLTDSASGQHKLAKAMQGAEDIQPGISAFAQGIVPGDEPFRGSIFQLGLNSNALEMLPQAGNSQVAWRVADVLDASEQQRGSEYVQGKLIDATRTSDMLRYLKGLPGVPKPVSAQLEQHASAIDALMPKRMQAPNLLGKLFNRPAQVDTAVQSQIFDHYSQGLKAALKTPVPALPDVTAAKAVDGAQLRQNLLNQLLDLKVGKQGAWELYQPETYSRYAEGMQANAETVGSAVTNTDASHFLGRHTESTTAAQGESSATAVVAGETVSSVSAPVGKTGIAAPMASLTHVKQNPGDYILLSRGKAYAVNTTDPASFFDVANREARTGGRVLGSA